MSWFDDQNLTIGSVKTGLGKLVPSGTIGNIGGDIIRDAIFGKKKGMTGPIRKRDGAEYEYLTNFRNFLTDIRTRGVARPNRYIVMFYMLPRGFQEINEFKESEPYFSKDNQAFLTRSCETAQFPGLNLQTQDVHYQSYMEKIPYMLNYNELNMSFRCDNEMLEKKFFDTWFSLIKDKKTGDFSYKEDYTIVMGIYQFNEEGKATYGIFLEGVYPYNMSDMELNQQPGADYHRFNVQLAFTKMYITGYDSPMYNPQATVTAKGVKSLSLYDRVVRDVFKQGKNIVLKEVNKKVPVGNVPGVGSPRDILGSFF